MQKSAILSLECKAYFQREGYHTRTQLWQCNQHLMQLGCRMQDMVMAGGLVWALPELGNDVYERFRGVRRPGTNRLVGGGWPLQVLKLSGAAIA